MGFGDGGPLSDSDVSRFWTTDGAFGYVNTSGKVILGPTKESPDHSPIFGWSEENKTESCKGISPSFRESIRNLPDQ